jgi:phosphopantetheinyl transferase (holo-ACP synthase)
MIVLPLPHAPQKLGNDVVDLDDQATAGRHEDRRFVERVCNEGERSRVRSKVDFWRIFAAKEAAYKALVKLGFSPGFAHRSIGVAPDLSVATWNDRTLALSIADDAAHVHAVAWSEGPMPRVDVVRFEGTAPDAPAESARTYAALCRLVATSIGCGAQELRVVREPLVGAWDGFGPPRVERAGVPLGMDVSLSHDGRFAAVAAALLQ